jgi:serine/threonine protein kinase
MLMGIGNHANVVHLVDFGLSREFQDPGTHVHIPLNEGLGFTGTATFASINSHLGVELGRRDDLESLAYVLFYFLWGSLPWEGLGLEGRDILESKQRLTMLDVFRELPREFRMFFEHCRSLSFDGRPDYDHFHGIFGNLLVKEGFQSDVAFDWDVAGDEFLGQDLSDGTDIAQHGCRPSHKRRPW